MDSLAQRVLDQLDPLQSERASLDVIYTTHPGGGWKVRDAALIIGPASVTHSSRRRWQELHDQHTVELLADLGNDYVSEQGECLVGRTCVTVRQATHWLRSCLADGVAPPLGALPGAEIEFNGIPTGPFLARDHNKAPSTRYLGGMVRPLTGFLFPLSTVGRPDPPANCEVGGDRFPFHLMSGIGCIGDPAPSPGLFIGRLERRAWLNKMTLSPDDGRFVVEIRTEAGNISLHDLELHVHERIARETVRVIRMPLGDLRLPSRPTTRYELRLPTVDSGVERSASLFDRNGRLLDSIDNFNFVERIQISLHVAGAPHPATVSTIGSTAEQSLAERLERHERSELEFRQLFEDGARRRVFVGTQASTYVRQRLRSVRTDLKIIDPYFGASPSDWDLISELNVSIQVLTGSKAVLPTTALAHVDARYFAGAPPYHDRVYLWGENGISIGQSPTGFGGPRAFRIGDLRAGEVRVWDALFAAWWTSSALRQV